MIPKESKEFIEALDNNEAKSYVSKLRAIHQAMGHIKDLI